MTCIKVYILGMEMNENPFLKWNFTYNVDFGRKWGKITLLVKKKNPWTGCKNKFWVENNEIAWKLCYDKTLGGFSHFRPFENYAQKVPKIKFLVKIF